MISLIQLFITSCLFTITMQRSTPSDDSYVAAVLEYQTAADTATNLANYLRYIAEAAEKNADIVVFPELTLNRWDPIEVAINGSLKQYPIPALHSDLYHTALVQISLAARQHQVYVVINIEEIVDCTGETTEHCPEAKTYLFNTNVVFDRSGAVIDRYRKINLFGEFSRTPALSPELGVFDTDFGVRFGHYICFDLMFQIPALQVVEKMDIKNVIFTTMWFSEMPYLTAVQIQEGYAYSMNVNFLASGANNVRVGSAGSGIFSGRAGALVSTMPGLPTTTLLVATVPKVPGQVTSTTPGPIYDSATDHDSLTLISDPSLPSHVTRKLVPGLQEFTLVDEDITCLFKINMIANEGEGIYKYRAAAFDGVRSFSGMATGGTRICSVFACTGDTINTCGKRFTQYSPNTTAVFRELSIIAIVTSPVIEEGVVARNTAYFPLSMDTSIMPLEPKHYTYSEDTNGNVTVYSLLLDKTDVELYSFAIWGRVFATDGQDANPPLIENTGGGGGAAEHFIAKILLAKAFLLQIYLRWN